MFAKKLKTTNDIAKPYQKQILYGRPRNGYVADIMRKTRSAYHYAIRHVRRGKQEVINKQFANAILNNHSRNFWDEVNTRTPEWVIF